LETPKSRKLPKKTQALKEFVETATVQNSNDEGQKEDGNSNLNLDWPWEQYEIGGKKETDKSLSVNNRSLGLLKHLSNKHSLSERKVLSMIAEQGLLLMEDHVKQAEELGFSPQIDLEAALRLKMKKV